jgi:hypothetical protein
MKSAVFAETFFQVFMNTTVFGEILSYIRHGWGNVIKQIDRFFTGQSCFVYCQLIPK